LKNWKKATVIVAGIFLILSTFGISACKEETKSIWQPKEPTKSQLVLLKKVYNDLYNFEYLEDELKFAWQGPLKEKFDQLCGEERKINIKVDTEDYQLPEETLRKRGGDCTDFANLFVSAARTLRISARVVIGKTAESEDHAWSEIYYQGDWQKVNPPAEIEKERVSLKHQLEGLVVLRTKEIYCRYDEKRYEGIPLIEIPRADKETSEIEFFNQLVNLFKEIKGREPTEKEQSEFKEMAKDITEQTWQEIIKYIPENPHSLIQPNHPRIKAWVGENGKG